MPSEIRRLIFHADELADALSMEAGRKNTSLPGGRISSCEVVSRPEVTLRIEVETEDRNDDAGPLSVTLEPALVAAVLIRFCMRRAIPLSRRAEKSLQIIDGHLVLSLTLEAPGMKIAESEAAWVVE
jgi:hypothetical protein